MFFDIGPLEFLVLAILGVLVFGPEKLPKVIQDVTGFIRKVRAFSDSAKEDIRKELGPEFKDFEFEDLNPKNFVRKQLLDNDELGLKDLRNGFDFKEEAAALTEAVHSTGLSSTSSSASSPTSSSDTPDLLRKRDQAERADPPPYDSDAT